MTQSNSDSVDLHPKELLTIPGLVLLALRHWKRLALVCAVATVVSYGLVWVFIKPAFKSSSLIIPQDQQGQSAAAGLLKGITNIPLSLGGLNSTSQQLDLFETILTSRTTLMALNDTFQIKKRLKIKKDDDLLKLLKKIVSVGATKQNAFIISCAAGQKDTAALMTNFLVDYLNNKVIELNVSKARENRDFLGKRMADIRSDLEAAEDSMTEFQKRNNIIELETQIKASMEGYAKIESELYLKEIEQGIMNKYFSPDAPQMSMLNTELSQIRSKMSQIKEGKNRGNEIIYPLTGMAQKSKEYLRLMRNITIYSTMIQVVLPLYEQAKYEEQKSIPVIQVIDRAVAPEKKFYPPRTLIAGLCGIITATLYLLLVFLRLVLPVVSTPAWLRVFGFLRILK